MRVVPAVDPTTTMAISASSRRYGSSSPYLRPLSSAYSSATSWMTLKARSMARFCATLCSKYQPWRPSKGPTVTGFFVSSMGLTARYGPTKAWTCSLVSICRGPMAPLMT